MDDSDFSQLLIESLLLRAVVIASFAFTFVWWIASYLRFFSLVDVLWALGIAVTAVIALLSGSAPWGRVGLTSFWVLLWSLRLAGHLAIRLRRHYPQEDLRYQTLREQWQGLVLVYSFLFFQFQALLVVFFSLPFLILSVDGGAFPRVAEVLGGVLVMVGWWGETLADRQLAQFKMQAKERGGICKRGLWQYSRHPNYFFEAVIWCGFAALAFSSPLGWLALICPLAMLGLLVWVTGVGPNEKQALKTRGDAYRRYQAETSCLIPWFKKNPQPTASE